MSSKLFRIGDKQIALAFVTQFQVNPGLEWEPVNSRYRQPSLHVQLLGNSDVEIAQSEAEKAGYKDAHAVAEALRAALEAM